MKKMDDGKATLRDVIKITEEMNEKLDDIKNTLNDKYVTKERHEADIAPLTRDVRMLIQFRYWLAGGVAAFVFLVEFFKERILGH